MGPGTFRRSLRLRANPGDEDIDQALGFPLAVRPGIDIRHAGAGAQQGVRIEVQPDLAAFRRPRHQEGDGLGYFRTGCGVELRRAAADGVEQLIDAVLGGDEVDEQQQPLP